MKYDSRKYIDLIRKAEGKWANWDPPIPHPEVGDYGTVDRDTGVFEKEGSIYDAEFSQFFPSLKEKYPPQQAAEEQDIVIKSSSAREFHLNASPGVGIANVAEASIKGKWSFPDERGALLIMVKSRLYFLPRDILLKQLVDIPILAGKSLVQEVVKCPSYAMYLSSKAGDEISLSLAASIPIVQVPGLSAGGELGGAWSSTMDSGVLKKGSKPGSYAYTPLFSLKKIRTAFFQWRRDSPGPDPESDDLWVDIDAPWNDLNDDGSEEEIAEDKGIAVW